MTGRTMSSERGAGKTTKTVNTFRDPIKPYKPTPLPDNKGSLADWNKSDGKYSHLNF